MTIDNIAGSLWKWFMRPFACGGRLSEEQAEYLQKIIPYRLNKAQRTHLKIELGFPSKNEFGDVVPDLLYFSWRYADSERNEREGSVGTAYGKFFSRSDTVFPEGKEPPTLLYDLIQKAYSRNV